MAKSCTWRANDRACVYMCVCVHECVRACCHERYPSTGYVRCVCVCVCICGKWSENERERECVCVSLVQLFAHSLGRGNLVSHADTLKASVGNRQAV